MISPEPEVYVVSVIPYSVTDEEFRVEAVFSTEADAVAHAKVLEQSTNYLYVTKPHKEMMSVVLDRLLQQKIRFLKEAGARAITLEIEE